MHAAAINRWAQALILGTGFLDAGAGLVLWGMPQRALPWVGLEIPSEEGLVYLRFVGAFVTGLGLSCLWAWRRPRERLRAILGVTVIIRAVVGTYVAGAIFFGSLRWPWLGVVLVDFSLVGVQLKLLARGAGRER